MPCTAEAWAVRLGSLHRRQQEATRRIGLAPRLEVYSTLDAHSTRHTRERHTHHHAALDAAHAHHRVVRLRPARGRVDHDPDRLPEHQRQRVRLEHHQDVLLAEHLLQAVEGQAGELALDEVWVMSTHMGQ